MTDPGFAPPPDRRCPPWYWADLGTGLSLMASDRHRSVVLCVHGAARGAIGTCDPTGRLVPLTAEDRIVPLIAAAPDLAAALRVIVLEYFNGKLLDIDRRNELMERGRSACERAGVL